MNKMLELDTKSLLPWRWAESMRSCSLFWIPANLRSISGGQREWLLEFFTRLSARVSALSGLRAEHFMQMQVIDEDTQLRKAFLNAMAKELPMLGQCWMPRGKQIIPPSDKEMELLTSKKKTFHAYDYFPQQSWWFLNRDADALQSRYLGYGGLTFFFRKPDTEQSFTVAPPADMKMIIPKKRAPPLTKSSKKKTAKI